MNKVWQLIVKDPLESQLWVYFSNFTSSDEDPQNTKELALFKALELD